MRVVRRRVLLTQLVTLARETHQQLAAPLLLADTALRPGFFVGLRAFTATCTGPPAVPLQAHPHATRRFAVPLESPASVS